MENQSIFTRLSAVVAPGMAYFAPAPKNATAIVPNITDKAPEESLLTSNGIENYQGVLLSLLVLQPDDETLKLRPISEGFKSGEKFRLRLGATFEGDLTVDNIHPDGRRNRLYPVDAAQVVRIKSATPVILPLEKDGFFEFDSEVGEEKLIITLRDSRAQGDSMASSAVHRRESVQGTALLQEIPPGKFPVIAESIMILHR